MTTTPDAIGGWVRLLLTDVLRSPEVRTELRALLREELKAQRPALPGPSDRMLTTAVAAEYAGVKEATIRDWISKGKLRAFRAGNRFRVRLSDLEVSMSAPAAHPGENLDHEAAKIISMRRRRSEGSK